MCTGSSKLKYCVLKGGAIKHKLTVQTNAALRNVSSSCLVSHVGLHWPISLFIRCEIEPETFLRKCTKNICTCLVETNSELEWCSWGWESSPNSHTLLWVQRKHHFLVHLSTEYLEGWHVHIRKWLWDGV